jgi:hypothetical protein
LTKPLDENPKAFFMSQTGIEPVKGQVAHSLQVNVKEIKYFMQAGAPQNHSFK